MVRRRELAARLKRHRLSRDMSIEAVADALDCSPAKISRLESADRGAQISDVKLLIDIYDIDDDEAPELLDLARDAKRRSWWQEFPQMNPGTSRYLGLEDGASRIRGFETIMIPGMMQTPDFAQAVLEGFYRDGSVPAERIYMQRQMRVRRAERLEQQPTLRLDFIIDESATQRSFAPAAVMADQMDRLVTLADMPHVTLRVVPLTAGVHPGVEGTFAILDFATDDASSMVYLESLHSLFFLDKVADLERYEEAFAGIERRCLDADRSLELLQAAAEHWRALSETSR